MPIRPTRRFVSDGFIVSRYDCRRAVRGQFWICKRNRTRSDGCGSRERDG
jgi:hypothetical protein